MLTAEQIVERRTGIGGSDVPALLGLSKWSTPLDVYLAKRGEAEPFEGNESTIWGSVLEPLILNEFERRTGMALRRGIPMMRDTERPWMIVNLDAAIADGGAPVEVKTARTSDGWGEEGTDEIPAYYHPQVAHELYMTGAHIAYVPVLIGGSDFRVYQVERDSAFINDIVEAEAAFWHEHVIKGVPPEPVNADDAARLWSMDRGTTLQAGDDLANDIERMKAIKAQIKSLEESLEPISDRVRIAFADNAVVERSGKVLATYKHQTAHRIDVSKLRASDPELAAKYTAASVSRVLRLK